MRDAVRANVVRWRDGLRGGEVADEVAAEEPLEIRVQGKPVSVTMRTPGHDHELAAGFLLSEGVLPLGERPLLRSTPNVVDIAGNVDTAKLSRHVIIAASCGICGKASIDDVHRNFPPIEERSTLAASVLLRLPETLEQPVFRRTGGLHAAALFDLDGTLVVTREDIGRHNAVDKVIGHGALKRLLPFDRHVLFASGRVSFEIMQKALAARIPFIAAVSAPSSLAVDFARESGQTLIGFLREGRMNVYSHPEWILDA